MTATARAQQSEIVRLLRVEAVSASPWRNGGGVTRRLVTASGSPLHGPSALRWTLSLADVTAPARFSRFPGMDRSFLFVGDGPARLRIDGVERDVTAAQVSRFPGEGDVEMVAGCGRAVNLMTRRDVVDGDLTVASLPLSRELQAEWDTGGIAAMIALEGSAAYAVGDTVLWATETPFVHQGVVTDHAGLPPGFPPLIALVQVRES